MKTKKQISKRTNYLVTELNGALGIWESLIAGEFDCEPEFALSLGLAIHSGFIELDEHLLIVDAYENDRKK